MALQRLAHVLKTVAMAAHPEIDLVARRIASRHGVIVHADQHLDEDHGRASSKIATWMSVGYQPAIGLNSCGQAEIAMIQSIQAFSTT